MKSRWLAYGLLVLLTMAYAPYSPVLNEKSSNTVPQEHIPKSTNDVFLVFLVDESGSMNYEGGKKSGNERDRDGNLRGNFLRFFIKFLEHAAPSGDPANRQGLVIAAYGFNSDRVRTLLRSQPWKDLEATDWQYDFTTDYGNGKKDKLTRAFAEIAEQWDRVQSKRLAVILVTDGEFMQNDTLIEEHLRDLEKQCVDHDREAYLYLYLMGNKTREVLGGIDLLSQPLTDRDHTHFRVLEASKVWGSPQNKPVKTHRIEDLMDYLRSDKILFDDSFYWGMDEAEIMVRPYDNVRIEGISYVDKPIYFSLRCFEGECSVGEVQAPDVSRLESWRFNISELPVSQCDKGQVLRVKLKGGHADRLAVFWIIYKDIDIGKVRSEMGARVELLPHWRNGGMGSKVEMLPGWEDGKTAVANDGVSIAMSRQDFTPQTKRQLEDSEFRHLAIDVSWAGNHQVWLQYLEDITPDSSYNVELPVPALAASPIEAGEVSIQMHLVSFSRDNVPQPLGEWMSYADLESKVDIEHLKTMQSWVPSLDRSTHKALFLPEFVESAMVITPAPRANGCFTLTLPIRWWQEEFFPSPVTNQNLLIPKYRDCTQTSSRQLAYAAVLPACAPPNITETVVPPNTASPSSKGASLPAPDIHLRRDNDDSTITNVVLTMPCRAFESNSCFVIGDAAHAKRWCQVRGLKNFITNECEHGKTLINVKSLVGEYYEGDPCTSEGN